MGGQIAKQKPPPPTSVASPTRQPVKKEGVRRRDRKAVENGKDHRNKYRSCPEVGDVGATPYTRYDSDPPRQVNVKIYRSYGNLDDFKAEKIRESRPDVRVYRRSTGNMSEMTSVTAGSGTSIHTNNSRAALARSRSADRYLTTPNGMPRNLDLWKMKGGSLDRHDGRVTTPSTTLSISSTSNWECKYLWDEFG